MTFTRRQKSMIFQFSDFCYMKNNRLEGDGLHKDDVIFVAGNQPVQEDKRDPNNLRNKVLACKVNNDHVDGTQLYMIDPRNLKRVSASYARKLTAIMKEDFKDADKDICPSHAEASEAEENKDGKSKT